MTTTLDTNHLNFFSPNVIDLFGGEEILKKSHFPIIVKRLMGKVPLSLKVIWMAVIL